MKRACHHSPTRMCCLHDDPWPRASDREKEDFPADNTPLFFPLSSPHAEARPRASGFVRAGESGEVTPPVHFFVSFRFRPDSIKTRRAREGISVLRLPIIWPLHTVGWVVVCRWRWWRRKPVRDLREGEQCSVVRSSHPYLSTHHSKVASLRNNTAPTALVWAKEIEGEVAWIAATHENTDRADNISGVVCCIAQVTIVAEAPQP
jgi:hypothetical protein